MSIDAPTHPNCVSSVTCSYDVLLRSFLWWYIYVAIVGTILTDFPKYRIGYRDLLLQVKTAGIAGSITGGVLDLIDCWFVPTLRNDPCET
jgi:hypothetical protein